MPITLAEINRDIESAKAGLERARQVRKDYLLARAPWEVGQMIEQGGQSYQVVRFEAHPVSSKVTAWCHRFTKAGKAGKLVPIFSDDIQ